MDRIAVIIPAKNEAGNISRVIKGVRSHLPEADIIVVDDNSDDATVEEILLCEGATLLHSPVSVGIGGAVQLGVRYALEKGCSIFIRMDGDGQHRAASLESLLRVGGPGILVQGSRTGAHFNDSSNWVRHLGSRYFQMLFRVFTKRPVDDPTSGLMCFDRTIAEKFSRSYPTDYPEIESLVLLLRAGHRVISSEVPMQARQSGSSSIGRWKSMVYVFSVSMAFL
nr:glycosyltransferase family 2 protein [Fibrobacterota bacterium]